MAQPSVLLEIKNNEMKELYCVNVDLSAGKLFRLVSQNNQLLTRAILEVMN